MIMMGLFEVKSSEGALYVVTFLDDFSKKSVVKPIARKSDVAVVLKVTVALLET